MRTKTLVLTAALGIFGAASSMAQVYSQNAVGFYTLNLKQGFNLVANQLNNGGNTINEIFPATGNIPDSTAAQTWDTGTQMFTDADTFISGLGWIDQGGSLSTAVYSPGTGLFLQLPAPADVVVVGEVPQGTGANALSQSLVEGFQIISQLTPQSIGLDATAFPAADGDSIQFWDADAQGYLPAVNYILGVGWLGDAGVVDPTPLIGEAVFYQRSVGAGQTDWVRDFSVNP